jgi:hypothetical protein
VTASIKFFDQILIDKWGLKLPIFVSFSVSARINSF